MLALICGFIGLIGNGSGDTTDVILRKDTIILGIDTLAPRVMRLHRVLFIGNPVTHDKIIDRELSLHPGDTVSTKRLPAILVRDKNKIYNLRLFNTVRLRVLELPDNGYDLLVEVTERWYTFPAPIFEFSDRNFNEWWENYHHAFNRINYGMRLYQYNFRGRNETLSFTAQFGFTRAFQLNYKIPYIDKRQKQGLQFAFDYGEPKNLAYFTQDHKLVYLETRETLRRSIGGTVSYNYRKSFYETHSISFGVHYSSILDTIAKLNPNYFPNGATRMNYKTISYSFNTDHRDVILYPLKGYQYTASISKIGLGTGDNVNMFEISATQARHWDLKKNWYFSDFTVGYLSTPRSQPYSLYNALGFHKQLIRGYEIYVIEGPAYFLNKSTLKKRIFYRNWKVDYVPMHQFQYLPLAIYIKGYYDFGYVQNYPRYEKLGINTTLSNKLLGGGGGGLDVVTLYDLVFRFEYSFTSQGTHGFFFNIRKEF